MLMQVMRKTENSLIFRNIKKDDLSIISLLIQGRKNRC